MHMYTLTHVYIYAYTYTCTHTHTHTHTHTCIHMYFQAGYTAVVWAQDAQTIDLFKGAGATMPEFPEEKKNDLLIEYVKKAVSAAVRLDSLDQ